MNAFPYRVIVFIGMFMFVHFSFSRMFGMVVEKLFVAEAQKVSGNIERKICAVGMIKILTEAPVMLNPDFDKLW